LLYQQSLARGYLMGHEETRNPSIAETHLLGRRAVRRAVARARQYRTRPYHRDNPLPAVAAILGGGGVLSKIPLLGGLAGRFRKPSEVRAAAVAPAVIQAANAGNLVAVKGIIHRTQIGIAKERAVWQQALAQITPALVDKAVKLNKSIPEANHANPEAFAASVAAAAPLTMGAAAPSLTSMITPGLVTGVVRAVAPKARRGRQRYPSYIDRQGRQRYSTKPPGTELRLPAGASPIPGTPYNFFTGAVGKGGAAATAGQVALAAGAGIAAYLVTQRVLQHLGGRAQKAEEAGVNAALAFRQARADFKQQHGRDPNRTELAEMKQAYQQQLVELGYDPVTFTRSRSAIANFLETYNPFGG
jgi:hypothetical protein